MAQSSQDPVVIVGADGQEHEFPAGMDPKRAAAIVRNQSRNKEILDTMEFVATSMVGGSFPGNPNVDLIKGMRSNPLMTTAAMAIPGVVGKAASGIAKGVSSAPRWIMENLALRPGIRVLGNGAQPITRAGSRSAQFPTVDIAGEAMNRQFPITNAGLVGRDTSMRDARETAMRAVQDASDARPSVAGLLPEGRTSIPLGPTPTPTGGRPSLQQARASERIPLNARRDTQGTSSEPGVNPIHGGMPAKTAAQATADVVEGAGTVSRTLREAGRVQASSLLPTAREIAQESRQAIGNHVPASLLLPRSGQMVGVDELLEPLLERRALMSTQGLPSQVESIDRAIAQFRSAHNAPKTITQTQALKDFWDDLAAKAYRNPADTTSAAEIAKDIAQGSRRAVEHRVPNVRALNAETQKHMALLETMKDVFETEQKSTRGTLSGLLMNPRVWGAVAQQTNRVAPAASHLVTPLSRGVPASVRTALLAELARRSGQE